MNSEDLNPADAELLRLATEGDEPEKQEPEESAEVNDEADEPETEPEEDKEEPDAEARHKPAKQRIAELTAARRQAEREAAGLRAELSRLKNGNTEAELKAPDPDDPKYEFGEADPAYLADLTEYRIETKLAERMAKAESQAEQTRVREAVTKLDEQWLERAAKASEKYPDFNEVVVEGAENGDWPLMPLSAAALQSSEAGEDIAYHLATNAADARKLADLERQFHETREAAIKGGIKPDLALQFAKPYLDRASELFEDIEAKAKGKPQVKTVTDAPKPPEHRARGGSGRFEVSDDTEDFAAFEAKMMRGR